MVASWDVLIRELVADSSDWTTQLNEGDLCLTSARLGLKFCVPVLFIFTVSAGTFKVPILSSGELLPKSSSVHNSIFLQKPHYKTNHLDLVHTRGKKASLIKLQKLF